MRSLRSPAGAIQFTLVACALALTPFLDGFAPRADRVANRSNHGDPLGISRVLSPGDVILANTRPNLALAETVLAAGSSVLIDHSRDAILPSGVELAGGHPTHPQQRHSSPQAAVTPARAAPHPAGAGEPSAV